MGTPKRKHDPYSEPLSAADLRPWQAERQGDERFCAAMRDAVERGDERCMIGVVLTPSTKAPLLNYRRGEL